MAARVALERVILVLAFGGVMAVTAPPPPGERGEGGGGVGGLGHACARIGGVALHW
jgi:hypothetical protein